MILTCIVTHNRLSYTKRCVESWLATRRKRDRLVIVDNASDDGTVEWLWEAGIPGLLNETNRYPGAACNQGWELGLFYKPAFLHRSDNDIEYLPGWQAEVERAFRLNDKLSLLGILNLHEDHGEPNPPVGLDWVSAVGGNVVIRAQRFRDGLRWSEQPWDIGHAEDSEMSRACEGGVARLRRTVANNIAFGRYADYPEYYNRTAALRGLADAVHSV